MPETKRISRRVLPLVAVASLFQGGKGNQKPYGWEIFSQKGAIFVVLG